jgi:hypothetical protein
MMDRKQTRLLVDANDLRSFDADLARKCVQRRAGGRPSPEPAPGREAVCAR